MLPTVGSQQGISLGFGTELGTWCRHNGNPHRGCSNLQWTGLWGVCVSHTCHFKGVLHTYAKVNRVEGGGGGSVSQRTSVTKRKICWYVEFKGGDKYNSSALLGTWLLLCLMLVTTKHTHAYIMRHKTNTYCTATHRNTNSHTLAVVRGVLGL